MLLTFEFKTVEEAGEFLKRLVSAPQQEASTAGAAPPTADASLFKDSAPQPAFPIPQREQEDTEHAATVAAGREVTKKRGRPAKKTDAAPPTRELTIDDCRQALSDVLDAKGYDEATRILSAFQAVKVGDVKPAQFAEFIQTCQSAIG